MTQRKKISIGSREEMDSVLKDIKDGKFEVTEQAKGKKPIPSLLPAACSRMHNKLGFTVKVTMGRCTAAVRGR